MSIGIAAIVKNELPYLIEWIAFHRAVKVQNFFIADNNSTDGTKQLLRALQAAGIINYIDFPGTPDQPAQLLAYHKLIQTFGARVDWLAFIDADEFIMPQPGCANVDELVKDFEDDKSVGAIVLNWAIYGSSGHLDPTPGLVIERFQMRSDMSFPVNNHYKSMVRPTSVRAIGSNPHFFPLRPDFRTIHANGNDVKHHKIGKGLSDGIIWDRCRLNHYVVKSRREFAEKKRPRGMVDNTKKMRDFDFYRGHDRNDVIDLIRDDLLEKTRQEIWAIKKQLGVNVPVTAFDYWSGLSKSKGPRVLP